MFYYTWLHCSIKDGSCIAITSAFNFWGARISPEMKKNFFHVKLNKTFDDCKKYLDTDENGDIVLNKFRYYVDKTTFFSADSLAKIEDPKIAVDINTKLRDISIIKDRKVI